MQRIIVSVVVALATMFLWMGQVREEARGFEEVAIGIERDIHALRQIAVIDSQITAVKNMLLSSGGDTTLAVPIYRAHIRHEQRPELIIAVISTESSYRRNAVSEVGALGLMQIMPPTAALFLPLLGKTSYDPFNPEDNIDLGTFYLSSAMRQYSGDMSLALADYFGGAKGARSYRQKDWDRIPKTAQYVQKVSKSHRKLNLL